MSRTILPPQAEAEFLAGVAHAAEFFMGTGPVQRALEKITRILDEMEIPYAVAGAMALNEYGYRRVTEDVDLLLTADGMARFKQQWLGRGYVEKFPGSRAFRDTENNVAIKVTLDDPGDGRLLPIERLVELKLASGMSAPYRLRDLADVLELIRVQKLQRELAEKLDESVREKYFELWTAAQQAPEE